MEYKPKNTAFYNAKKDQGIETERGGKSKLPSDKMPKYYNTAVTLALKLRPVFFFKSSAAWRKERNNPNIDNGLEVPVDFG